MGLLISIRRHVHLTIAVLGLCLTSTPPTALDYFGENHYRVIFSCNIDR